MTVHGVASDDFPGHVESLQQLLHGRYLVGFLIVVGTEGFRCERAPARYRPRTRLEHLFGLEVVEIVEAAFQCLAVERDDARSDPIGREIEVRAVFTKHLFDIGGGEPLQNIANGRMRWSPLPVDPEGFIQRSPMHLEIRLDAAIRIGPAHDGENGKQQYVRQPIEFALRAARVRDCGRAVQRSLLKVIEKMDFRPPKAAARRSCWIVSV